MKKQVALSILCASMAAISTASAQASELLPLIQPDNTTGGSPVYTVNVKTPDGQILMADELMVMVGKTCNTMAVQSDVYSTLISIPVITKNDPLSSDDLIRIFGASLGCMRVDIFYGDHKAASTGNISLTWDGDKKQYVAASPSVSDMQF